PAVAALVRIRPKAVLTPLLAADSPFEIALPMRDPILRNPSAALLAPDLILSHVIIAPSCAVSRPETRLPPIAVPAVLSAGPILDTPAANFAPNVPMKPDADSSPRAPAMKFPRPLESCVRPEAWTTKLAPLVRPMRV